MEPVKRPTLHLAADAAFGLDNNMTSPTSAAAAATGFLPDMPQWKKDLIQRRKTNVARTQAAQQASPTANTTCMTTMATTSGAAAAAAAIDIDTTITGAAGSCGAFLMETTAGAGAGSAAADLIATEQQQQQQQQSNLLAKKNVSQTQTTTEEKSEKSLIGGHHTQQQAMMAFSNSAETTATTTIPLPIPKQRSSLFNTTTTTTTEPQILNMDLREQKHEREREEREREHDVVVNNSGNSGLRGEVETGTETSPSQLNSPSQNEYSSRSKQFTAREGEQLTARGHEFTARDQIIFDAEGGSNNTKELLALIDNNKNCKTKIISDKLQSNKFIKQQQQQKQQQQLSPTKVTVKTTMVAMQEMKKTTKQNGQHRHHLKSTTSTSCSSNSNNNSNNNIGMDVEKPPPSELDEDLSYGPGIVSKLRCRYLSLALRESHQQNQKQRLQRSTSLNTLLDRDDDEEEVVVVPVTVMTTVTTKSTAPPILGAKPVMTTTTTNSNTTITSGYIKGIQRPVSLGATTGGATNNKITTMKTEDHVVGAGATRSRHIKRGNEVMKRARSVEALLCEKSPWNTQRTAMTPISPTTSPSATSTTNSTCVTIEDKIHNARERLHSGTDTAPPKRLTSIIDDTERPPPDLVKQTLKMFEASANRRPRAAHRSNGVGGVASKVATYKSIIKEQKSSTSGSGSVTPTAIGSPNILGKRDPTIIGFASSTPKQQQLVPGGGNTLSHPPDVIPRQMMIGGGNNGAIDSPVSALSKMLGRCQLTEERETEKSEANNDNDGNENENVANNKEGKDDNNIVDNDGNNDDYDDHDADDDDDGGNDNDNNHNDEGDGGNGDDNMGAAGDKHKPPTIAIAEGIVVGGGSGGGGGGGGGGSQRSFAAAVNENAHVTSSNSSSSSSSISSASTRKTIGEPTLSSSTPSTTKQIGVIRPLFNNTNTTSSTSTSNIPLTSREIEKNRINEMKKSGALAADGAAAAGAVASARSATTTTSLDTVINTKDNNASETDATNASPIWALRKLRQPQTSNSNTGSHHGGAISGDNNTSMVFNFSKSTKEVPDYIESDVVIYRRKRELPKPNEPGFVLLGDLSVETSTDTDYDDYSMCPPSPCDVEFENANIVIDGKSSIRQKTKDASFRVQFNDTLTSTFEYPSEASLTIDDPPYADPFGNVNKYHQLLLAEQMQLLEHQQQQQQHHHHVTVDEIIELPTSTTTSSSSSSTTTSSSLSSSSVATSNMLGNLPLDYPNLEKGLILQQSQEEQPQEQQQQRSHPHQPEPIEEIIQQQSPQRRRQPSAISRSDQIGNAPEPEPLLLQRRVRRSSVLLKPQYACFLQNEPQTLSSSPAPAPPPPKPQPRKAASFSSMHNLHPTSHHSHQLNQRQPAVHHAQNII
ncbi:rho GTPase-activating protein gacHH isoform X3 [Drosophila willistoni]|uniref:rho GTPase-activating protein gacHH isoform X3 n=1 Tax=Drosophila willistoni TaxID=7260 RepID=UPI000C26C53C|nr:rho GTPase-activating protein gacHH isoform X3 [Drosophila willistoni]